jgi:hypothetical protein
MHDNIQAKAEIVVQANNLDDASDKSQVAFGKYLQESGLIPGTIDPMLHFHSIQSGRIVLQKSHAATLEETWQLYWTTRYSLRQ